MSRVLVTGAGGFIASGVIPALRATGHEAVGAGRRRPAGLPGDVAWRHCDLAQTPPLAHGDLAQVGAVVHLAALAHRESPAPAAELARINVAAPAELAAQAAEAGVRRFVLVSSATVYGERGGSDPFSESSPVSPSEPYARSKAEGEQAVGRVADETGLEVTIVRPPLVYGPGAKGNFARLLGWALAGRPLPRAARYNRRSFVGLANLADLLVLAATRAEAAGETFVVCDGEDLSTGELYARICRAAGTHPRFWPVPRPLLSAGFRLTGRGAVLDRLLGDFRLNASNARRRLGWRPSSTVDEELGRAVAAARTARA